MIGYNESDNVSLVDERHNGFYVCFWSTDHVGNVGSGVSQQISGNVQAIVGDAFVSTWDTRHTSVGSSSDKSIKLPLEEGGDYDFTVNWGDGVVQRVTVWNSPNAEHEYSEGGVKVVNVTGKIKGFRFDNKGDRKKLINISSFGNLSLGNKGGYFRGAENLVNLSKIKNLEGTTNFARMFQYAYKFNADISKWDVSSVVNMTEMFAGDYDELNDVVTGTIFNQSLSGWDVSSVRDMSGMFSHAVKFNQSLGEWDVSSVVTMKEMFKGASVFNQSLTGWDVCNVEDYEEFDTEASDWNAGKPMFGPCIVSVSSPDEDKAYGIGDVINVSLNFQRNISVDLTSGRPYLVLKTGTSAYQNAVYDSVENETLKFAYTIMEGDVSTDLNYKDVNSLVLNGSIITDDHDGTGNMLLPAPATSQDLRSNNNLVVDGVKPDVVIVLTGTNPKSISATDDDSGTTIMKRLIQTEDSLC